MARWAVVGASSFSGSAFCNYLSRRGESVFGFSRGAEFFNLNQPSSFGQVGAIGPDFVVNFSALNMVAESWEHYRDYYRTNVLGVAEFARYCSTIPGMGRFVQVSTPEVYGAQQVFLKEDSPYNPSTPYAVSRAAADMDLMALYRSTGFPVSFTRSVNVYGPGQQPYRIIPKTVLSILRGRKLQLHGGGASTRSFIHIRDVCDSIFRVATRGRAGEVYHTSTAQQTSIRTLVGMICVLMGKKVEDVVENSEERPGKDMAYQLDSSKIRAELGWNDAILLGDGLRDTVGWIVRNEDAYEDDSLEYEHKG